MDSASEAKINLCYYESYNIARSVSLRQIQAFKALIEHGTTSRAALVINLSQPAVSKLIANLTTTLCELVAAGHGVSLVHPIVVSGQEHRLQIRPFKPDTFFSVQLCRNTESRNAELIDTFAEHLRTTSMQILQNCDQ